MGLAWPREGDRLVCTSQEQVQEEYLESRYFFCLARRLREPVAAVSNVRQKCKRVWFRMQEGFGMMVEEIIVSSLRISVNETLAE